MEVFILRSIVIKQSDLLLKQIDEDLDELLEYIIYSKDVYADLQDYMFNNYKEANYINVK